MCIRLGVICIVIRSSLMFLVFFVYVFDKEKLFISVLSQHGTSARYSVTSDSITYTPVLISVSFMSKQSNT